MIRKGYLLQCINDIFTPQQIEYIPNRPCKGSIYETRKRLKTRNGDGLLLIEIENPLINDPLTGMKFEPSFSVKRFVVVDDLSNSTMIEEINEVLELETY